MKVSFEKEYSICFRESKGLSQVFRITSRSLLGAKQKASRMFNLNQLLSGSITAIEIQDAYSSTHPFCVAHKFIGSKKWSSFE
ncbi:hypothetical protein [Leptospira kirschneri]|uniref:hypothetical protein n=1 Tax=Leptospira kirschneri TaxID=29507 RepID=UPI0035661E7A